MKVKSTSTKSGKGCAKRAKSNCKKKAGIAKRTPTPRKASTSGASPTMSSHFRGVEDSPMSDEENQEFAIEEEDAACSEVGEDLQLSNLANTSTIDSLTKLLRDEALWCHRNSHGDRK